MTEPSSVARKTRRYLGLYCSSAAKNASTMSLWDNGGLAALLETRLDITVAIDEIHRVLRTRASCDQRGDGRNLGTAEVYSVAAEQVPICRDALQELRT
jgi:hypothetical protein